MNQLITTILFWGFSLTVFGQIENPYLALSPTTCPFDSTQEVMQPSNWLVYQSIDDHWDSAIDSSICVNFVDGKISLDQLDLARPLFVRSIIEPNSILLTPDWIYSAQSFFSVSDESLVDTSSTCVGGICTGLIVRVAVPNEDNTAYVNRDYAGLAIENFNDCYSDICLPTEYFSENYLNEYLFKFTLSAPDDPSVHWLVPMSVQLEDPGDIAYINDEIIVEEWAFDGTAYNVSTEIISDNWSWGGYLAKYNETNGYPSASNNYFIEARPALNASEQAIINIHTFDAAITFQPFTNLRGALVDGQDSLRHQLNIINDGGSFCFSSNIAELVIAEETNFLFKSGTLDFSAANACMQFKNGGSLIVADHTTMHYGNDGLGMISLRQGGTIKIGENSTFVLNNTMIMNESAEANGIPQQIYIELNEGSQFVFGEHSHLTNKHSIDEAMRLNVYMNGGLLDDSNLSPSERTLINRIYPESDLTTASFSIYPNPIADGLYLNIATEQDENIQFQIYDLAGKLILSETRALQKGVNDLSFELDHLPTGMYLLAATSSKGTTQQKFVKE